MMAFRMVLELSTSVIETNVGRDRAVMNFFRLRFSILVRYTCSCCCINGHLMLSRNDSTQVRGKMTRTMTCLMQEELSRKMPVHMPIFL